MKRIVILISGRGSNMAALLQAAEQKRLEAVVAGVISNRPDAAGLAIAMGSGVATRVVDHRAYAERADFERELAAAIDASQPDLIVLAGFMRVLSAPFVERYAGRLLNIHPSLLPAYPGLHTHRSALADGVKIHGCTVHFVTATVDHGPVVAQGAVAVHDDDTEASLAARVLAVEHRILVAAVRWYCQGRLVSAGGRVRVKGSMAEVPAMSVPLVER